MKALIATKNSGKIESAKKALEKYYENVEVEGIPVPSDVPEQPVNDQICQGARNRVKNLKAYAKENNIEADFYMSAEGGIHNFFGMWENTNLVVIEDANGTESVALSPSFPVPERLVDEIIEKDFSQVMNRLFTKDEERHNRGGGIQLLSDGKVTRIDITEMAFIMALTKYINGEIWK